MLEHGGRLYEAARAAGIPVERWLDLSTGISPFPYPLPSVPLKAWHRLPEQADGFLQAAQEYYGVTNILPIAGSQAVVQLLPRLWPRSNVAVIKPTYKEHPHAWRQHGHTVVEILPEDILNVPDGIQIVIVCNPENPTATLFASDALHKAHRKLQQRGGLLIVDEAFIDVTPEHSIIRATTADGLLVLRSLGKFFGMGGARVGFASANHKLLEKLDNELGPWTISGPSRFAAAIALRDQSFQREACRKLQAASNRLQVVLTEAGLPPCGSTAFFQWVRHDQAKSLFGGLLENAVLARCYDEPASLRFGLPADEAQFDRLKAALGCTAERADAPPVCS